MMGPVNQPAQIIPLVHAPHVHAVAHPERDAFREIQVVRDEQRLAIACVDDEALMAGTVIIVRQ